ncbi:MAG: AMP-binding protein [Acutalibacteraceae bacterium]
MIELLKKSFFKEPDKIAYATSSESITYNRLWSDASKLAFKLRGSKKPVIVKGHKQVYMITSFLACIMASRPYIPCDSSLPEARIKKIAGLSGADTVLDGSISCDGEALTEFSENDEDTVYIIYTSGSTGEPKGVPISRGNLKAFIKWITSLPALESAKGKTVLNQAIFSFDLSVADIYFSLCTSSTLFALTSDEEKDPAVITRLIGKSQATAAVMTPTFAKYCMTAPEFQKVNIPCLSSIFFCGELLEPKTAAKLFDRFSGIRIINAYGPTEATCAVTAAEITKSDLSGEYLPCGEVKNSTCEIKIDSGEIALSGASVFKGYLGSERLKGHYMTGDKGEITDGKLFCFGRKYGYIKYKGHRIELEEIRRSISEIENVEQCSVFTIGEKTVLGIAACVTAENLTESEIKEKLLCELPPYMIPKTVKIRNKISFNGNGKQNF